MFLLLLISLNIASINCSAYVKNEYVAFNRTIVITGAAQGIGYAIADNFLYEGARIIIILDINVQEGKQAAKQLNTKYGNDKAVFIKCDVRKDLREVSNIIINKFKYVDVFVNDAAIQNEYCPKKTFETIALATIQWSLKFREYMRKDKNGRGGTIINLASTTGHSVDPFTVTYKSAKYAVIGFTKSLGHVYNYKQTGVRVVALCPGVTETRLLKTSVIWKEQRELFHKYLMKSPHQTANAVGKGALQVYKTAKTGTVWDIIGGQPPKVAPVSMTLTLSDLEEIENE